MRKIGNIKVVLGLLCFVLWTNYVLSQGIAGDFKASVDRSQVAVGQRFTVSFAVVNQRKQAEIDLPKFDGLKVLSGPSKSSQSSFINGESTQKTIFSYVLTANKAGSYEIGRATLRAGSESIQTKPIKISVVADASELPEERSFILRAEPSKREVFVGEPLVLRLQLYYSENIEKLANLEPPAYDGFWYKEVEEMGNTQGSQQIDGIEYRRGKIYEVVLIPQKPGEITIPSFQITILTLEESNRRRSFFGFGPSYKQKQTDIRSRSININVKPLPSKGKPADFSGAVGQYTIKSVVNKTDVKANESINYNLILKGTGNIELLGNLKQDFPPDLETYDPEVKSNIAISSGGMSGTKNFEYLLIPRFGGEYEIPGVNFSYFDPIKEKYQTLAEEPILLSVAKDNETEGQATSAFTPTPNREKVRQLGTDIRFLETGPTKFQSRSDRFFGSVGFYGLWLLPLLAGIGYYGYERYQANSMSDVVGHKRKQASKWAKSHLKQAHQELNKTGTAFFEEISKALSGFVADKMNLTTAELNRDRMQSALKDKDVEQNTIDLLMKTLDECEMARFSPVSDAERQQIYDAATQLLNELSARL